MCANGCNIRIHYIKPKQRVFMYNVIHTETEIISLYGIQRLLLFTVKVCTNSVVKKTEPLNRIQIKFGL